MSKILEQPRKWTNSRLFKEKRKHRPLDFQSVPKTQDNLVTGVPCQSFSSQDLRCQVGQAGSQMCNPQFPSERGRSHLTAPGLFKISA